MPKESKMREGSVELKMDPAPKSGLAMVMSPGTLCAWASGQEVRPGCHPARGSVPINMCSVDMASGEIPQAMGQSLPMGVCFPTAALLGRGVSEAGGKTLHEEHLGFKIQVRIL